MDWITLVRIKYMENLVQSVVAYSAVHLLTAEERLSFLRTFAPYNNSDNAHWADLLCTSSRAF